MEKHIKGETRPDTHGTGSVVSYTFSAILYKQLKVRKMAEYRIDPVTTDLIYRGGEFCFWA